MRWKEVGAISEVPVGQMEDFKVGDEEICIANVEGNLYTVNNRCGHMNAPLCMGTVKGNIVTCCMHSATFDVTTGRKQAEPVLGSPPGVEKLPPEFLEYMGELGKLMAKIETRNLPTYGVKIEGEKIWVDLD